MVADFAELQSLIGGDGASARFAEDIVKSLRR
jgi:hypothetical protein